MDGLHHLRAWTPASAGVTVRAPYTLAVEADTPLREARRSERRGRRRPNYPGRGRHSERSIEVIVVVYFWGCGVLNGDPTRKSYVTHIREVALLPGERLSHAFSPTLGLTEEPPVDGQILITTNQRIMAFSREDGRDETYLVPVEELKGVVVKSSARGSASLIQGLVLVVGGLFIYLIVSYWLTGQFKDGWDVPLVNMDLGSVVVLIAIAVGGLLIGKYYFAKETGSVTFQGSNWLFTFPFRSSQVREEVYQLVNTLFVDRRSQNAYSPPQSQGHPES